MKQQPRWCRFCGQQYESGHPGCRCAASVGTLDDVVDLYASAHAGSFWARSSLSSIAVADARTLLESLVNGSEESAASGAASALGNLADPRSRATIESLLHDRRHLLACVRYLGRLGDDQARDTLHDLLDDPDVADDAAVTLGSLGDRRAVPHLVESVRRLGAGGHIAWYLPTPRLGIGTDALTVLAFLGDRDAVPPLSELLDHASDLEGRADEWLERRIAKMNADRLMAHEQGWPFPDTNGDDAMLRRQADDAAAESLDNLAQAIRRIGGPDADVALQLAAAKAGRPVPRVRPRHDDGNGADDTPTAAKSMVPAWALKPFQYTNAGEIGAGTRFRGQPSWRTDPTWPLNRRGTPMSFWAQFDLPWDSSRTAYLFLDVEGGEMGWSEDGSACLFVQPSPFRPDDHEQRATGPIVPDDAVARTTGEFAAHSRVSFVSGLASLEPFDDPVDWADAQEADLPFDKVGGTPNWLQGDQSPDGDSRFLFQFSADGVGHELADGADCYGFVDDRTGEGWFLWQCH